jgi:diguanylate cyclase (GGDEF)-like protein/PAS domain S-box-containing protein
MPVSDTTPRTRLDELINEITDMRTERELLGAVARILPTLLPAERASVALPVPDGQHLELSSLSGPAGLLPQGSLLPVERSWVGHVFRTSAAGIHPAERGSPLVDMAALAEAGFRQCLIAPLTTTRGAVLGTLNVASRDPEAYHERHLRLLEDIGRFVASTVDQRRLGTQAQRASAATAVRLARLELLNEIAEELSACRSVDQAHQALLTGVCRFVPDAPRASVVRFDETLTQFRVIIFSGVDAVPMRWQPVRGASFEHLIATGDPVAWANLGASGYWDHRLLSRAGLSHSLSIPMGTYRRIVGAVNLGLHELPADQPEMLEVLRTLGKLGGATLDRLVAQAEADAALGSLIDGSPVLLLALDTTGYIQRVSRLGAAALGYQGDLLIGEPFAVLHPDEDDTKARTAGWGLLAGDEVDVQEVRMRTRDGELIWARQSARVVQSGSDGSRVLVVCEDVSSVRELTETLTHQAGHDALTGLPNRRTFAQALQDRLDADGRPGSGYALLFVDLDRFKAVNDRFGHGTGDLLLCAVADRLRAELTGPDLASRIGGDEFQVLLGDVEGVEQAVTTANAMREALLHPFEIDGHRIDIGCSIGISAHPADGDDPEELIRRADTALRHAKLLGRNNVQVYRAAIDVRPQAGPG